MNRPCVFPFQRPLRAARRALAVLLLGLSAAAWAGTPPPDQRACNATQEGAHQATLRAASASAAALPATAAWLDHQRLRWGNGPALPAGGRYRLLHSASAALDHAEVVCSPTDPTTQELPYD